MIKIESNLTDDKIDVTTELHANLYNARIELSIGVMSIIKRFAHSSSTTYEEQLKKFINQLLDLNPSDESL